MPQAYINLLSRLDSDQRGRVRTDTLSKYLTPSQFGDTIENCTVTILLLRAWCLWRAHRDGWASANEHRKRDFVEERVQLLKDAYKIQMHHDGSLGHHRADALWKHYQEHIHELV